MASRKAGFWLTLAGLAALACAAAALRRLTRGGERTAGRGAEAGGTPAVPAASAVPVPAAAPAIVGETKPAAPCAAAAPTVWWTDGGKTCHRSRDCFTLKRSAPDRVRCGTEAEARAAGKTVLCTLCGASVPPEAG